MDLSILFASLEVSLPVFAMVFLGAILRRLGWIDQQFVNTASSLVFKATMPTLLFLSIAATDTGALLSLGLTAWYLTISAAIFCLIWLWALWRCPHDERGVFVQGAFRGNCGIVGLALSASMYGDTGLSLGSIMAGGIIIVNLVLSAIVLSVYSSTASSRPRDIVRDIATNPLIIGIVAALPLAWLDIQLPGWLLTSGNYFASLSLPLALICIGGSLSLASARESSTLALSASIWKVIIMPVIGVGAAICMGYRGAELGIMMLFFGSPTAAVAYVMARGAGGNERLAASIIMLSTLMSLFTISAGLLVLKSVGLIQGSSG
nr:AEC family transporter [Halomonas huangheensis]